MQWALFKFRRNKFAAVEIVPSQRWSLFLMFLPPVPGFALPKGRLARLPVVGIRRQLP